MLAQTQNREQLRCGIEQLSLFSMGASRYAIIIFMIERVRYVKWLDQLIN